MRLWHKDLLNCLDDFHIVAQWRELLAIKNAIDKNGTPNHRLVNKVLDYSVGAFRVYTMAIISELEKRNIKYIQSKKDEIMEWQCNLFNNKNQEYFYQSWHNDDYLIECYFNLREKHTCGIVSDEAWKKINDYVNSVLKINIERKV